MKAHSSPLKDHLCPLRIAIALTCLVVIASELRAEWGGTLSGSAAATRVDTVNSTSVDQQYSVFTSAQPIGRWNYYLNCRYRHLQSQSEGSPSLWQTELQPTATLRLAARKYSLRGEYLYRANRDELKANELTGQSLSGYLQSTPYAATRLYANGEWAKNVNDLELIGFDTRSSALGAGATYSGRRLSLLYSYTDRTTKNEKTRIDRLSRSHVGKLDNTLSAFSGLTRLQTSLQITERNERDRDRDGTQSLISLPVIAGLYAPDPSPEFGELRAAAQLVDGNVEFAAAEDYDLSAGVYHNFGLDFGADAQVDHLHLYTDTLAAPLVWSIWTSSDNLTWTNIATSYSAEFSPVFRRYEFVFTPTLTRYIKIAVTPEPSNFRVSVTELRAFVARGSDTGAGSSTDRRGSGQVTIRPAESLNLDLGGNLARVQASQTGLAREEDGLRGSLRFTAAKQLESIARFDRSRSRYPESTRKSAITELSGITLRSTWNAALSSNVHLIRTREHADEIMTRRSDAARAEINTIILPALKSTTQAGYTEDHRFDAADIFYTRFISQFLDGQPTSRSDFRIEYRREKLSAEHRYVPGYRETVSLRGGYRFTSDVNFVGNTTEQREPGRYDRSLNGIVSWTATRKLTVSAGVDRLAGNVAENSTQYSLQTFFRWTVKTDVSAAFSFSNQADRADIRTGRVGLNSRF